MRRVDAPFLCPLPFSLIPFQVPQPSDVPVLEPFVYEFVCYPDLIENLRQHRSVLQTIKMVNQSVLALKDPSLLPSFIVTERRFTFRSEDYLHYRIPDLRPIHQLDLDAIDHFPNLSNG